MIETRHDVEALGYEQELKRSLSLFDLLAYGLVFITPLAPVSVFGIVFNTSHGMVPLVYLIGLVAMVFVALSYMTMSEAFPVAGSVYAYASRSLGSTVGFFAGWAMLLDYLLLPTLTFIVSAIAISSVFPAFPKPLCVVVMVVLATIVNELGIESTARTSFVLLAFQMIVLAIFGVDGALALAHHAGGAHLSWTPFFNPAEISASVIFGALSLAVLSFLGFDAISTLSEESNGGAKTIGRATMLSLVLSAILFVAQSWLASQFLPGRTSLARGNPTNEAFYDVAGLAGGTWLKFLLAVPGVFFSSLAGAVTAQAATARLIFGMARDGELPRALARVDSRRKVPTRAVYLVAGLTLILGVTLVDQLELFTSMVSFGALLGFLVLQVSVVAHFVVRGRSRNWLRHLITPAIAFAIVGYVLLNAEANAKIAGVAWLAVGLVVYLVRRGVKRSHRHDPT